MGIALKTRLSPEDYLAQERLATSKSEYLDGELRAMAGASEAHDQISVNCVSLLHAAFVGRECRVHSSDMRVFSEACDCYFYPDISAVCGKREFQNETRDVLLNPTLIIEVMSPSTESYDRRYKAECYRKIPSLQQFLFVSQSEARIELYSRQTEEMWLRADVTGLNSQLRLDAIDANLRLSDIYDKVEIVDG